MSSEIIGTKFKYTVDTSYGINQDGFIAIGTESIVYRGLKTADKGGLQFSCVLKFKPKYVYVNGTKIDRVKVFKDEELKIFEDLQECTLSGPKKEILLITKIKTITNTVTNRSKKDSA